jgi:hypothetical protein
MPHCTQSNSIPPEEQKGKIWRCFCSNAIEHPKLNFADLPKPCRNPFRLNDFVLAVAFFGAALASRDLSSGAVHASYQALAGFAEGGAAAPAWRNWHFGPLGA